MKIEEFVSVAQRRGIVSAETAAQLISLRAELDMSAAETAADFDTGTGLNAPHYAEPADAPPDTEAPRFIRGFHDILITIGIIVALTGLWTLGSVFLVIPAIIGLSEYFVKRQRLALPAFTLTIAIMLSAGSLVAALVGLIGDTLNWRNDWYPTMVFFSQFAIAAAYYWRYRVPIALAGMIWAAFAFVFFLVITAMGAGDVEGFLESNARTVGLIGLAFAIALFAVAMRFDMADRMRVTRRSDVAFWLHLITAPALLFTAFVLLFGSDGFWWADEPNIEQAFSAIGLVMIMMIIGIVIDRRAFVTSGLISLGVAFGIITQESGLDVSSVVAFAMLAVGVIVLLLGSGWQWLRGKFVTAMPDGLQRVVPPVV